LKKFVNLNDHQRTTSLLFPRTHWFSCRKLYKSILQIKKRGQVAEMSKSFESTPENLQLATVVEALRARYVSGRTDPITLKELIEECNLSIGLCPRTLQSNQRIHSVEIDGIIKFAYKPPLDLQVPRKQHLLNLLKSRYENCEKMITMDEVQESLPPTTAHKFVTSYVESGNVVKVTNADKQEVLFFTDPDNKLNVNGEFVRVWREISFERLDDKEICDYIDVNGHYSLKKPTSTNTQTSKKKPKTTRRHTNTTMHNEHVADQFMDYSNHSSNT